MGQQAFDFNPACRQAYEAIIQWKFSEGQQLLAREKKHNPSNLVPYFLENYIDFFTLFYNEEPEEYKKRLPNLDSRIALMNKGPQNSPFLLYTKAVIHFQWAAIKIKFGNNWDAGWEFRRSFLQLKENRQRFPSFHPNECYFGALQVAVGTIPDGYKWLSNLLGMKGSINSGMKLLNHFLERKDEMSVLFHSEASFFYCYLKFYIQNERDAVFDFIKNEGLDVVNNHLFAYLATNLSLNNQQSGNAIKIITGRNMDTSYFQTPVWDFELAYAKLHHLEPDAGLYFENFLRNFKGKFYVKDALQKLSWHYYLAGNQAKARHYRSLVMEKGSTDSEADKQALKEARSGRWPNKLLLEARLLNDGGYCLESLRLLQGMKYTDFPLPEERIEFSYRAGRLYDDSGNDEGALQFYKEAIRLGSGSKEYFAARAALQIGMILEKKGEKQEAIQWYQRCIAMKDHDFKNSLDQRAKAGIERCEGE